MPKEFFVNGDRLTCDDQETFDRLRDQFKENVIVDDRGWESKKEMEEYDAKTFIEKARFHHSQSPPDIIQAAEKLWFAAVYAVKKLFLLSGGIDIKSNKSLTYFCNFAIFSQIIIDQNVGIAIEMKEYWTTAEKLHSSVYGSTYFKLSEYEGFITDIEKFVNTFATFDTKNLMAEFNKVFIVGTDPKVNIKKVNNTLILGGTPFKCSYSVFVV